MENCTRCFVELTTENHRPYLVKRKSKICGKCRYSSLKKNQTYYKERKEKAVFKRAKNPLESRLFQKFNAVEIGALRRGLKFEITKENFVIIALKNCFYCAVESTITAPNGLDRLDSSKNYVLDNVVSCCKFCNFGKNTQSVQEYVERCNKIIKNHALKVLAGA